MDPNAILNRIMRLARLDTGVFDEVRDDQRELVPAIAIVAISALLAALGGWLWLLFDAPSGAKVDFGNVFVKIILMGTVFTVVLWAVWAAVTYVVLVQFYKEQADLQMLLRTMGYAAFPLSLSLLMFVPGLSLGFAVGALVLWFVMSTYAVQSTTSGQSNHVVIANAAGFLVFALVMALLARSTGMGTSVFLSERHAQEEGKYYKADVPDIASKLNDLFNQSK
jgi:hypothetical protein